MPHHGSDFFLIAQAVGSRNSLLGITSVIYCHQLELLAVDPALGIDCVYGCLRARLQLLAECRTAAGHGRAQTDFNLFCGQRRRAQGSGKRGGQNHSVQHFIHAFLLIDEHGFCARQNQL